MAAQMAGETQTLVSSPPSPVGLVHAGPCDEPGLIDLQVRSQAHHLHFSAEVGNEELPPAAFYQ